MHTRSHTHNLSLDLFTQLCSILLLHSILQDESRNVPGLLVKAATHFHRGERVGHDETPEQQAAAAAAAATAAAASKTAKGKRADGSAVSAVDVVAKEKEDQRRKEYEYALKCVRVYLKDAAQIPIDLIVA